MLQRAAASCRFVSGRLTTWFKHLRSSVAICSKPAELVQSQYRALTLPQFKIYFYDRGGPAGPIPAQLALRHVGKSVRRRLN
jgi:hypothetical protein